MYACGTMERTPNFICQVTEASATFNIAIKANLNWAQGSNFHNAYAMNAHQQQQQQLATQLTT